MFKYKKTILIMLASIILSQNLTCSYDNKHKIARASVVLSTFVAGALNENYQICNAVIPNDHCLDAASTLRKGLVLGVLGLTMLTQTSAGQKLLKPLDYTLNMTRRLGNILAHVYKLRRDLRDNVCREDESNERMIEIIKEISKVKPNILPTIAHIIGLYNGITLDKVILKGNDPFLMHLLIESDAELFKEITYIDRQNRKIVTTNIDLLRDFRDRGSLSSKYGKIPQALKDKTEVYKNQIEQIMLDSTSKMPLALISIIADYIACPEEWLSLEDRNKINSEILKFIPDDYIIPGRRIAYLISEYASVK